MCVRITVVGGGSQYVVGLSESLIDYAADTLAGTEVVLLDILEDPLGIVHDYATQLSRSVGADITFVKTTDRRKAFEGADFILTTFRPGTHEQQLQDEEIPPKYELQGNETIGIGGIGRLRRVRFSAISMSKGMVRKRAMVSRFQWQPSEIRAQIGAVRF